MSAISMPETTTGTSAFATQATSAFGPSLLTVDAQVRYVVAPQGSAVSTHAAAAAGVPASDSNRKWGRPPRGEPR